MTLNIYNTLKRQKEEFKTIEEGKVRMYVCGVTVYDLCHLGHARALITFDLLYRYLLHKGYEVDFVRNFTDIDDKIIDRSNREGIDWKVLTEKYIEAFNRDTGALGLKKPTHEPKATDNIEQIIDIIKTLQGKGLAYEANGDVFYSVRKFDSYGKLSGKNIEDLAVGARVDVREDKKDPLDFALWKSAKPGEPKWDSPWGEGRPGWHIECSAMSMRYLGSTFDIHGGGRDLIFPHHENEIAQSEGCTGHEFAKYWIHNGFVNIDAEKMSKSLNNFMTIRDILDRYPAEVIRLFILSSHYRSPIDYTDQNIYNALSGLERFYSTMKRLNEYVGNGQDGSGEDLSAGIEQLKADFITSMDDDFNSAKVVGQVFEWVRNWNKALDAGQARIENIKQFQSVISEIGEVFGVFGAEADSFLTELKSKAVSDVGISEEEIQTLIEERKQARANKDFARSDEIRDELAAKGIQLKDNPDGTTGWTVK